MENRPDAFSSFAIAVNGCALGPSDHALLGDEHVFLDLITDLTWQES